MYSTNPRLLANQHKKAIGKKGENDSTRLLGVKKKNNETLFYIRMLRVLSPLKKRVQVGVVYVVLPPWFCCKLCVWMQMRAIQ